MKFKVDFSPRSKKHCGMAFEVDAVGPIQAKSLGRQMLMNLGENCADYKEPKARILNFEWEQDKAS